MGFSILGRRGRAGKEEDVYGLSETVCSICSASAQEQHTNKMELRRNIPSV